MKEVKPVLCLDFDDVIMRTKPLVESLILRIENKASEQYMLTVNEMFRNNIIDAETKGILIDEHFDYKDRVLEEVDDKYKGLIDYNRVININNIYPGAVEYINYLCRCGHYDKVYIVSHYNVDREVEAKKKFISRYLPMVEFIPVPFHKDVYEEGKKRKRTNKAQFVKDYLASKNIPHFTLIDDSLGNGKEWREAGGIYIKYDPVGMSTSPMELKNLSPLNVIALSEYPKLESGESHKKR